MSVWADAESLGRLQLFRGCETVPLQILAFSAERLTFEADDALFSEGEASHGAYFIMSGSVSIVRNDKILSVVEEGALLGETSMIGLIPYSITARARDTVNAARFDQQLFLRVAGEYPDFGKAVLSALGDKLSDTVRDFDRIRVQLGNGRTFSSL
jgi:CRP/FNR family transcriptional regulator, cyclic AMP receptor protein